MRYLVRFFEKLNESVSPERFGKLYRELRGKYASIAPYLSPGELLSKLHKSESPDYRLNDNVLTALITEYQLDRYREKISSFLLVIFRPGLTKIFYDFIRRMRQFPFMEYADLWSQIVTRFFEELNMFDLAKDRVKVASKVLGRVKNHLRDYFRACFRAMTAERDLINDPEQQFRSEPGSEPEEAARFLKEMAKAGMISQSDKHILLATRVYGKSMKEFSREPGGMSYENIRQRRSRCEKAIREHLTARAAQPN